MVLNYIWVAFFVVAFIVALGKLLFMGDTEIFTALVNSTFDYVVSLRQCFRRFAESAYHTAAVLNGNTFDVFENRHENFCDKFGFKHCPFFMLFEVPRKKLQKNEIFCFFPVHDVAGDPGSELSVKIKHHRHRTESLRMIGYKYGRFSVVRGHGIRDLLPFVEKFNYRKHCFKKQPSLLLLLFHKSILQQKNIDVNKKTLF